MNIETASRIKFLVNDPSWRDIEVYVEDRVSSLSSMILQAKSFEEVCELRGRIFETKRLLTLRDEVLAIEKEK